MIWFSAFLSLFLSFSHTLSLSHFMRELDIYFRRQCHVQALFLNSFHSFALAFVVLCYVLWIYRGKCCVIGLIRNIVVICWKCVWTAKGTPMNTKKDWFQIHITYIAHRKALYRRRTELRSFWMCMLCIFTNLIYVRGSYVSRLFNRLITISLSSIVCSVYILQWTNKQLFILYRWESLPGHRCTFDEDLSKERFISTTNIMWLVATVFHFNIRTHNTHSFNGKWQWCDNETFMQRQNLLGSYIV